MWFNRFAARGVLLACWALPAVAHGSEPPPRVEESVLVERIVWPAVVHPHSLARDGGRCDRLAPADLRVTEDGREVRVVGVGRRPPRRVHALLIDTSVSMRVGDRLEHARQAALRYIERLPPDEPVLVAGFDDSLELRSPPTLDRARVERAVRDLQPGNWTALWDAVRDLVLYLDTLPGHKTLVLLTDGEDSTSTLGAGARCIREHLAGGADLSVFPIGLDLHRHSQAERFRVSLRELAAQTGGLYFESRGVELLDRSFDRLREQLEQRVWLTYQPTAPAAPAGDRQSPEPVRVRISARRGVPCKVRSAGPPNRNPRATSTPGTRWLDSAEVRDAGSRLFERLAPCLDVAGAPRTGRALTTADRESWREDEAASLWLLEPATALAIRTPDVLTDRGVLFHRQVLEGAGRYRVSVDRPPVSGPRDALVELPPLAVVRESLHGPGDVLRFLLERGRCTASSGGQGERETRFVHGRTWLELREAIARALYEADPDYRAWAAERLRVELEPDVEHWLAEQGPAPDAARRERLRAALVARELDPASGSPQRVLAEWLGDVGAREAALALEAQLADALLVPERAPARTVALATRLARDGWPELHALLPPAVDVRVVVPLVLVWSEERQRFGFHRFVLPRPRIRESTVEAVPQDPLALRSLAWLRGRQMADDMVALRVQSVDQPLPVTKSMRRWLLSLPQPAVPAATLVDDARIAELRVADAAAPGGRLVLTAWWVDRAAEPAGVAVCDGSGTSQALRRLGERLRRRDARVVAGCRPDEPADE